MVPGGQTLGQWVSLAMPRASACVQKDEGRYGEKSIADRLCATDNG